MAFFYTKKVKFNGKNLKFNGKKNSSSTPIELEFSSSLNLSFQVQLLNLSFQVQLLNLSFYLDNFTAINHSC